MLYSSLFFIFVHNQIVYAAALVTFFFFKINAVTNETINPTGRISIYVNSTKKSGRMINRARGVRRRKGRGCMAGSGVTVGKKLWT